VLRKSPELVAVIKRLSVAVQTGDKATVQGLIADRPETLLVGSDVREWLYGREASEVIAAQLAAMPEYERTFHHIEAYEDGSTGWGARDSTVRFPNGLSARSRATFVFRLEAGAWRVVQWHASVPTPGADTHGLDIPQNLSDLIDSLDADFERSLQERFRTATVTLLISDIEGSANHGVELGDAAWSSVVQRHFDQLHRIANAQNGTVVKTMGDGALIVFDSAVSGALAGIEIQRSVSEQGSSNAFRVRVGLHTGDAVHTEEDYFGYAVNKTARIAAAAAGGQILVSDTVQVFIAQRPEFVVGDAIALNLKGLPGTHLAFPLTAV
jgi:class 3 adenylate cyclase